MSDQRNGGQSKDDTPGHVSWRFRDLFKGLERKPEANPSETDNANAQEDPLVRETRRLAAVTRQLVIWTRVIAGIAILAFFASLLQWDAMRSQLTEMKGAGIDTKNAIRATNRLATAAEISGKIARDTEIQQLRAYIEIGSIAPPQFSENKPATLGVEIKNTGRTPAYKVTPRAIFEVRSTVYAVPPQDGLIEEVINPDRFSREEFVDHHSLSKEQIDQIIDGSKFRLYTWGTVYFIDAFGMPRHANFCEIHGGHSMQSAEYCAYRGAD